jgi:hypothetical protein
MTGARWAALTGALLLCGCLLAAPPAGAAGEIEPGAYCPFPKKGETPSCMEPAQQEYGEFFTALDDGDELSEADVSRLERDVASGAKSDTAYLAISSLSYGYFRLSQQAAANPGEDPAVVARLQRWNELLGEAYDVSAADPAYRQAVREAALDLQQHAPAVELDCADERGETVACNSTEVVLRGFNRAEEQIGIRGALGRLLHRMLGGDGE